MQDAPACERHSWQALLPIHLLAVTCSYPLLLPLLLLAVLLELASAEDFVFE